MRAVQSMRKLFRSEGFRNSCVIQFTRYVFTGLWRSRLGRAFSLCRLYSLTFGKWSHRLGMFDCRALKRGGVLIILFGWVYFYCLQPLALREDTPSERFIFFWFIPSFCFALL